MINLVVINLRGAPVGRTISAQFGPAGGTIGRAATNTLVLDDPDRTVSRVHAQVECRDGRFFITDRGSNPLQHNGRALGAGRETELELGDRLAIGSFELVVQSAAPEASRPATSPGNPTTQAATPTDDDPFADLLAGLGPAPVAPAHPATPAARQASADSLLFPDPLAASSTSAMDDPFAELLGSSPAPAAQGLPDDFSDLGLSDAGKTPRIDDLFAGTGVDSGNDPLALSPLADPLRQPNTASSSDPFEALQGTPKPTTESRSDHLPIGQFGYVPPKAIVPSSPDEPFADLFPATPVEAPVPAPAPPPAVPPARRAASAPVPAPALRAARSTATDDALLAAFLRGIGSTYQVPDTLTPELMERIGLLLRDATEGTLQLLQTRQQLKREVRADVTMISAQANNPLKFSPTVEVALGHLLGPGARGYMSAEAAMRDAYDDLRAHEFGVMVGMRAALAHVLERFTPDELEKKIAAKSALDSLFAASRKAKLWDQFVALYAGIAAEAEDDFHSLFGKAFLKAYEEQMARLKSRG